MDQSPSSEQDSGFRKLHQGSHVIIKHASGQMNIQAKYNNNKNPSHQQDTEQPVDLHGMDVTW